MPQTSISQDPAIGAAGLIAFPMMPRRVMSRTVNQSGGIPFGVFVSRQADERVKLPTTSGEVTATGEGFAVRDPFKEQDASGVGLYANGDEIGVMRSGFIWVQVEAAVTEEGQVFARFAANGGNTQLGAIRGDADTASAAAVPNARFVSSTSGPGLAIVEVK